MRISTIFLVGIIIASAFALYQVKYKVHEMKKETAFLQEKLETSYKNIHILEAEWSYLTSPERLESLNSKYLSLKPSSARQLVYNDALSEFMGEKREAEFVNHKDSKDNYLNNANVINNNR